MKNITQKLIEGFKKFLISEEKSDATIEKYIRDIYAFSEWLCGRNVDKTAVLEYKSYLVENYKPATLDCMF